MGRGEEGAGRTQRRGGEEQNIRPDAVSLSAFLARLAKQFLAGLAFRDQFGFSFLIRVHDYVQPGRWISPYGLFSTLPLYLPVCSSVWLSSPPSLSLFPFFLCSPLSVFLPLPLSPLLTHFLFPLPSKPISLFYFSFSG